MTPDQIAELKRIAEAARHSGSLGAEGRFDATFDPPTCLALIAENAAQAARIEALEGEREAARADLERHRRPKCSCMEVYGENPNCIQHGHGTEWAKANPDICAWADERRDKDARIEALEAGLRPFGDAAEAGDDGTPDTAPAWESGMAMAVTHGDFRRAANLLGDRHDG